MVAHQAIRIEFDRVARHGLSEGVQGLLVVAGVDEDRAAVVAAVEGLVDEASSDKAR